MSAGGAGVSVRGEACRWCGNLHASPVAEVVRARERVADADLRDLARQRAERLDPVDQDVHAVESGQAPAFGGEQRGKAALPATG